MIYLASPCTDIARKRKKEMVGNYSFFTLFDSLSNCETINYVTGAIEFGYKKPRQVFTDEEEMEISRYLKESSDIYFGLTPRDVRRLAFDYAKAIKKDVPKQWVDSEIAGK